MDELKGELAFLTGAIPAALLAAYLGVSIGSCYYRPKLAEARKHITDRVYMTHLKDSNRKVVVLESKAGERQRYFEYKGKRYLSIQEIMELEREKLEGNLEQKDELR